ncbi:unnamed protein product, partial [Tetraodon nigroviridis]
CSDCGKAFKKKGHLLQHGVLHSSDRPYGCSTCSRAFNRRESLTRHEKIHEEKPFRCPACGRAFRESTSLLNHAASGTCGKPGRGPKLRGSKTGTDGEDRVGGGGGGGNGGGGTYQSNRGVVYGKTEEEDGVIIVGDGEPKSGLGCDGLFQSGRGGNSNDRDSTDGKYPTDYSRNRYTGYHDDHRSQELRKTPRKVDSPPNVGSTRPEWVLVGFHALTFAASAVRVSRAARPCADTTAFTPERSPTTAPCVGSISERLFTSASIKRSTRGQRITNATYVERNLAIPRASGGTASSTRKVNCKRCPRLRLQRPSTALTQTLNVASPKTGARTKRRAPPHITTLKMSSLKTPTPSLSLHLNPKRRLHRDCTLVLYVGNRFAITST